MIYIRRSAAPQLFLNLKLRKRQLERIREWFNAPSEGRGMPPIFDPQLDEYPEVVKRLRKDFSSKCAFCEQRLNEDEQRFLFFRPLGNARQKPQAEGGAPDSEYYFWLIWDWSNVYLACRDCRDNQGDEFPTQSSLRVMPHPSHLDRENSRYYFAEEQPLLLDPCLDAPANHLVFVEDGRVKARDNSPRGARTICVFKLDRNDLEVARAKEVGQFKEIWLQARNFTLENKGIVTVGILINQLLSACDDHNAFAGMKRQLLLDWLQAEQTGINLSHRRGTVWSGPLWRDLMTQLQERLYPQISLPLSEELSASKAPFHTSQQSVHKLLSALVNILTEVSVTATYEGRSSLLESIVSRVDLDRSQGNIRLDLVMIVSQLWEKGPRLDNNFPLLTLIDNTQPYVKGYSLADELFDLRQALMNAAKG